MANPAAQQRQRRANLKLAVVLASVALVFGVGFVTKIVLLGR
ncbi:cytochrome oxidase small assembly protein [Aquabacterium sp. OR-4]|nr:cytochrome oxidase small assembly protein [Aquabacterium sp. OR-4]MDT7834445.1 cytochrome oxidase small assembly protein [Aquabacterium sp. OR-4]